MIVATVNRLHIQPVDSDRALCGRNVKPCPHARSARKCQDCARELRKMNTAWKRERRG